jgi:hypothetical protein
LTASLLPSIVEHTTYRTFVLADEECPMECAGNNSFDSYTRYRTAAVAVMQQVAARESAGNLALLLAIAAFWGYVLYMALETII